jgi:hypothetical protein
MPHPLRLLTLVVLVFTTACSRSERKKQEFPAGTLCSVKDGAAFRIAKILAKDEKVVHLRLYQGIHANRPATIDVAALKTESQDDPAGPGLPHLPLKPETFQTWEPERILEIPVTDEEKASIQAWKDSGVKTVR